MTDGTQAVDMYVLSRDAEALVQHSLDYQI